MFKFSCVFFYVSDIVFPLRKSSKSKYNENHILTLCHRISYAISCKIAYRFQMVYIILLIFSVKDNKRPTDYHDLTLKKNCGFSKIFVVARVSLVPSIKIRVILHCIYIKYQPKFYTTTFVFISRFNKILHKKSVFLVTFR